MCNRKYTIIWPICSIILNIWDRLKKPLKKVSVVHGRFSFDITYFSKITQFEKFTVVAFAVMLLSNSFWPKIQLLWQIPEESKRYQEKSQGPKMTRFLQPFLLKTLLLRFHPQLKIIRNLDI